MSTEIIDFKTPGKLFELEVRGFVVLSFDLHGTTLIELAVYNENKIGPKIDPCGTPDSTG